MASRVERSQDREEAARPCASASELRPVGRTAGVIATETMLETGLRAMSRASAASSMGFQLVTQCQGERTTVRVPDPALIMPVYSGLLSVVSEDVRYTVDRSSWLLVRAGARSCIEAMCPRAHTLVLSISPLLEERVANARHAERSVLARCLSTPALMARSTWVNEIAHRYLAERQCGRSYDIVAMTFLENEIVKELCAVQTRTDEPAAGPIEMSALVKRAVAVMEEHLFEPQVVTNVAARCGASPSTLLRAFKRELGRSPATYIRARRLNESLLLLRSRRFAVSEVAVMVGYRNFSAFSEAFRLRFGMRPSDARRGGSGSMPATGEP